MCPTPAISLAQRASIPFAEAVLRRDWPWTICAQTFGQRFVFRQIPRVRTSGTLAERHCRAAGARDGIIGL